MLENGNQKISWKNMEGERERFMRNDGKIIFILLLITHLEHFLIAFE